MIAGFLDAYGMITYHTYLSFMSGNTTQAGYEIGQGKFGPALYSVLLAIVFFVGGSFAGTLLARSSVQRIRRLVFAAIAASLKAPNYLLKIIPQVDGTARICELVEYYLEDIDLKGAWTGPGALELHPHALAPVAELPVLEVISATHIIADLTLGLGKVVWATHRESLQDITNTMPPAAIGTAIDALRAVLLEVPEDYPDRNREVNRFLAPLAASVHAIMRAQEIAIPYGSRLEHIAAGGVAKYPDIVKLSLDEIAAEFEGLCNRPGNE